MKKLFLKKARGQAAPEYAIVLAALTIIGMLAFQLFTAGVDPAYTSQTERVSVSALNGYDNAPGPKATLPAPHPFPGPT